jgi:hypothetical protein
MPSVVWSLSWPRRWTSRYLSLSRHSLHGAPLGFNGGRGTVRPKSVNPGTGGNRNVVTVGIQNAQSKMARLPRHGR